MGAALSNYIQNADLCLKVAPLCFEHNYLFVDWIVNYVEL